MREMWRPRSSLASPELVHKYHYSMEQLETGPLTAFKEFYSAKNHVKPKVSEEPVCKQIFQNHLPAKKNKPASWQNSPQDPMVPLIVSPGYVLSKNKTKYKAIIKTEEFFNATHAEDTEKNNEPMNPERDILLEQLHQQIADLKLSLEEERYDHKQSNLKAEQFLSDKVKELQTQHQDEISKIEDKHRRDIKELEENHRNQFESCRKEMECQIESMKEEYSFLQSAFTSYQATLLEEMDTKWSCKEQEYYEELEAKSQEQINTLRERLEKEKELEINNLLNEHHDQEEQLKKELDEKLESMAQYYNNVMEELKEMNSLRQKLKNTQMELEHLKSSHADLETHFNSMNKEFINTRGLLKAFEDNFDKKVDDVDDRYKQKINNLMMMNAELRKTFRKKCEELANNKYCASQHQEDNIRKIKDKIENCLQKKTEIPNFSNFQIPPHPVNIEATEAMTVSAKDYHQLLDKDFLELTAIVKPVN